MSGFEDLWIGDLLRLKKSGRQGKFIGTSKDGRLRIQVHDKVVLARFEHVELLPEPTHHQKLIELKEEALSKKLAYQKLEPIIDLHIEKLNPNLINALPERIADFQVKAFETYMDEVVKRGMKYVTIIHGKGTGVLKTSIHTFLKSMEEVNHFHLIHNGGATEVVLK